MTLHEDALTVLRSWRPSDDPQEQLRGEYVEHLATHPDGLSRDCWPDHVTAGALVLSADRTQVLLTLHAKARRWFHLGGHCEPRDATLTGAALREAVEESGLDGLVLDPEPLHLDAHVVSFCGTREQVRHLDVRFLALAPAGAQPLASEESLDVRWWPADRLPTEEPGLRAMVDLARLREAPTVGRVLSGREDAQPSPAAG